MGYCEETFEVYLYDINGIFVTIKPVYEMFINKISFNLECGMLMFIQTFVCDANATLLLFYLHIFKT